jgi:hypothetical protein
MNHSYFHIDETHYSYSLLVELPMPCMSQPASLPPSPSPNFTFRFFGNPEILFYLATLHRLNWFAVAAANVLCWILAF